MRNLFIVILTFNSTSDTHVCLESLSKMDTNGIKVSIVIVDNASKEQFKLSKEEKKQDIYLIRNEDNLGFTGGNNVGMKFALQHGADCVMLLNNDTIVDNDLVKNLAKTMEEDEKIGLVSPKIYFAKGHEFHKDRYKESERGKVFWYAGGGVDWANINTYHRGVDEVDRGQYDKEEEIGFATGCCMFIKAQVLKEVGLFDDRYFLYSEDADLCERIKRAGFKIIYEPKAVLWHVNAGSTGGSGSNLHDYFITRNRMLFGMTYAPFRAKFALLRQSLRLALFGRPWQRKGIQDYYFEKFGKGTYSF